MRHHLFIFVRAYNANNITSYVINNIKLGFSKNKQEKPYFRASRFDVIGKLELRICYQIEILPLECSGDPLVQKCLLCYTSVSWFYFINFFLGRKLLLNKDSSWYLFQREMFVGVWCDWKILMNRRPFLDIFRSQQKATKEISENGSHVTQISRADCLSPLPLSSCPHSRTRLGRLRNDQVGHVGVLEKYQV